MSDGVLTVYVNCGCYPSSWVRARTHCRCS